MLTVLLLTGCQSKRNLTVKEHSVETVEANVSADETHAGSRNLWSKILATCDSLNLSLTADSVRTPDGGVVYNPVITVNAVAPSMSLESKESETTADSLHVDSRQTADASIDIDVTDNRDTVAVAKPPGLRWIFTVVIVLSLLGLIIFRYKITK